MPVSITNPIREELRVGVINLLQIGKKERTIPMIKGVTKSIIEVKPKNSCFEKVIIILNSDNNILDRKELEQQAELIARRTPDFLLRSARINRLKMAAFAAAGAFFTAFLFTILYIFV